MCMYVFFFLCHIVSLSASMLHLGPCCVRRRDFLTVELKEDREDYRQLLWTEDIITHAQSTRPHVHTSTGFLKGFSIFLLKKPPLLLKNVCSNKNNIRHICIKLKQTVGDQANFGWDKNAFFCVCVWQKQFFWQNKKRIKRLFSLSGGNKN